MKKWFLYIIVLSFLTNSFGQQKKLSFTIIGITSLENASKTEQTFEINCLIKNIHSEEISFFFNNENLLTNKEASLSNALSYRFYKENSELDLPIFNKKKIQNPLEKEKEEIEIKKNAEALLSELKQHKNLQDFITENQRKNLFSNLKKLNPNESLTLKYTLTWDKIRTILNHDEITVLETDANYYLSFSLYLHKKPFEKHFTEEEKQSILENPNFIETSIDTEKFKINLN